MIWTDRYGHQWDLESRTPCRRCGQDRPGEFDSTCRGKPGDADAANRHDAFGIKTAGT